MTVRDAVPADAEAVTAIWNHYIRDTIATFASVEKTPAEVAGMIRARPAFFVAEVVGTVAGFATYAQFRGGDGYARCMEHTVHLAPAFLGQGLGRALLTMVENHARAGGAHSIFAGVSAENAAGRAFHVLMGYDQVAVLQSTGWKFGRWHDLVLMQKFLT